MIWPMRQSPTLHIAWYFAEEVAVEPRPIDGVSSDEGGAEQRSGEVGDGQVHEQQVLRLAHVGVPEDGGDEERIASDGDKRDGDD